MADRTDLSPQAMAIEDVRHVAKLSRLALGEAQLAHLAPQLQAILGYVAKISQVNVDGVEPMAHPLPLSNVLREDVITPSLPIEATLRNAPDREGPFFAVPKVIGGDEDSAG